MGYICNPIYSQLEQNVNEKSFCETRLHLCAQQDDRFGV